MPLNEEYGPYEMDDDEWKLALEAVGLKLKERNIPETDFQQALNVIKEYWHMFVDEKENVAAFVYSNRLVNLNKQRDEFVEQFGVSSPVLDAQITETEQLLGI